MKILHGFDLRSFNLETADEREKDVQDIDVHGEVEKFVVTLLVMRHFSTLPGASRACADFRDSTGVFRFNLLRLSFITFFIIFGLYYSPVATSEEHSKILRIELGDYQYMPDVININVGQPVVLQLVNTDILTPHTFVLQDPNGELDVDVTVYPGEPVEVRLQPQTAGLHTFYCDKKLLFMKSHRQKGMEGTLVVQPELN